MFVIIISLIWKYQSLFLLRLVSGIILKNLTDYLLEYHEIISLLGSIRGLKNQALDDEKKQAEQMYKDAMNQYIATRLGRPLERMSVRNLPSLYAPSWGVSPRVKCRVRNAQGVLVG